MYLFIYILFFCENADFMIENKVHSLSMFSAAFASQLPLFKNMASKKVKKLALRSSKISCFVFSLLVMKTSCSEMMKGKRDPE